MPTPTAADLEAQCRMQWELLKLRIPGTPQQKSLMDDFAYAMFSHGYTLGTNEGIKLAKEHLV